MPDNGSDAGFVNVVRLPSLDRNDSRLTGTGRIDCLVRAGEHDDHEPEITPGAVENASVAPLKDNEACWNSLSS